MKILLISLSFVLGTFANAQDVRTFYQAHSNNIFSNSLFDYENEINFVSIKESTFSELKIISGKLDDDLNTSNYKYVNLFLPSSGPYYLSGSAVNGNRLVLVVLSIVNTNIGRLNYITIDLTNFSFVTSVEEVVDIRAGYFRSLQNGTNLVTYVVDHSNALKRFSYNPLVQSSATIETVDTLSSLGSFQFRINFEISGAIEYVQGRAVGNNNLKIIKRNTMNEYSSKQIALQNFTNVQSLNVLPNGNVFVAYPKSFCILNQNLDSLTSGDFPSWTTGTVNLNSRWGVYSHQSTINDFRPNGKKYVYDLNMNLMDSVFYDRTLYPEGVYKKGNLSYLFGQVINPGWYNKDLADGTGLMFNVFVIKNLSNSPFSEYGRMFNHHNLNFQTGSCGTSFMNKMAHSGYTYSVDDRSPSLLYMKSNILAGLNLDDELTGFVGRYGENSYSLPGPLYTSMNDFNEQMDKYNRGYYVTKEMIQEHLTILNYGNPNYIPAYGIRNWPAHGNVSNGEAANVADFIDVNSNGVYEPMLGDYPKIFGDKCLLNIYHQSSSNPVSNKLEVHQYFFTFDCDTSEMLKNTVFENMRVINRGGDLDEMTIGSYLDFDLGGPMDDYVGTNVDLGMVYVYNGDFHDEGNGTLVGFFSEIPAQGMMVLNGMRLTADNSDKPFGVQLNQSVNGNGFDDGIIDNEYYTLESSIYYSNGSIWPNSEPTTVFGYWNVLNGLAQDGSERMFAPSVPNRYDFFGTSDPLFYATRGIDHGNNYSEIAVGNPPSDRRMIAGAGAGFFASGDTINYITAHITSFDTTAFAVPTTGKLFSDATWLKNAFANNDLGCGKNFGPIQNDLSTKKIEKYDVNIYPNPFSNEIVISNLSSEMSTIHIYNIEGKSVYNNSVTGMNAVLNLDVQPGIYIVHVSNNNGTAIKRIVRN